MQRTKYWSGRTFRFLMVCYVALIVGGTIVQAMTK